MSQHLTEGEVVQAVQERLKNELKPGDRIIVEREEDGFCVHSEFREIRSESIKATVGRK